MAKKVKKKPTGPPVSSTDARLPKYLADPALRSRLREGLLSPTQRREREQNADPYFKPVQAAARTRYSAPKAQVQDAIRQTGVQATRTNDYYDIYQRELAAARDRQQAQQAAAAQGVAGLAQGLAQLSTQQNAAQGQSMAADAASRGAQVDPTTGKAAADANLLRNALGNLSSSTLTTQGVNNNAAMETRVAGVSGQKARALEDNAAVKRRQEKELAALFDDEAAFKVQTRQDLIGADHKAALEAKAFGLDAVTKVNPATGLPYDINPATGRPYVKPLTPGEQGQKDRNDFFRKHGYYPPTGPPKAAKPPKKVKPKNGLGSRTKADEGSLIAAINDGADRIRSGAMSRQDLASKGKGTPEQNRALANAANDMARLGYLSPANVRALQRLGVHVAGFPRSKAEAKKAGTLPKKLIGAKVGEALKGIGTTVAKPRPSEGPTLGEDK